ncbi:hypothetical protein [Abyssisolibacter fermentans]|nr:hypothetical protein [Abyssisolibacter fermentans]
MKKLMKKINTTTIIAFKFECRCNCDIYYTDHYSEYLRMYRIENNEPIPE